MYTSSLRESPATSIKLLYKFVTPQAADRLLESVTSDTQELSLPESETRSVAEILDLSNSELPNKERTFQEWKVGFLSKAGLGS